MPTTRASLTAAAIKRAGKAQAKVRAAEGELDEVNKDMKKALPHEQEQAMAAAIEHTTAAQQDVHDAAEDLEAVQELLEQSASESGGEGARSGQGLESVLRRLRAGN